MFVNCRLDETKPMHIYVFALYFEVDYSISLSSSLTAPKELLSRSVWSILYISTTNCTYVGKRLMYWYLRYRTSGMDEDVG